jgi:hypothetical protein
LPCKPAQKNYIFSKYLKVPVEICNVSRFIQLIKKFVLDLTKDMLFIVNKLHNILSLYNSIACRYNIVWSFFGIWFAVLGCFKKVPKNVDYLFLCHDVHRNVKKDGKLYAPLIDPIIEELSKNYRCLTLVTPFSRHYGNNCFGDVRMHNFVVLIALIKRIFQRFFGTSKGIENDPLVLAYKGLLNKIRPKLVIGIQPSVEFCVGAKLLGITTCDMQHGLISDINYYSVAKRQVFNQQGWPDHILCWDEESSNRITKITEGNGFPNIIGNPSYHSSYGLRLLSRDNKRKNSKSEFKMEVIVTGTYHSYGLNFKDEGYRDIGIPTKILNLIKDTPDVFWRLRLHPVIVKYSYKHVDLLLEKEFENINNIDWNKYSHMPLVQALNGVSGHVTVLSASALDAAQNLIPTLLVSCPGASNKKIAIAYFKEYLDSGMMAFVENVNLCVNNLDYFQNFTSDKLKYCDSKKGKEYFSKFIKLLPEINST